MFRIGPSYKSKVGTVSLGGLYSFFFENDNFDTIIKPKFDNAEYEAFIKSESGWTRVKRMYILNEEGHVSTEMNSVLQATFCAGFVGACIGGVTKSRSVFNNFIDSNHATAFKSNIDAKRKLQTQIVNAFGKGGFYFAWRFALFTSLYCGISTTISVYRGKSSVWEYSSSGLLAGFLYKIPLGLRASLVGSAAGGIIGTIAGGITILLLRSTGTTIEEVRYWQYQFKNMRNRAAEKSKMTNSQEETESIMMYRQHEVLASKGPNILQENTPSK